MSTLLIPTEELADALVVDLEGRLEVMRDDDDAGDDLINTPDYVDCENLLNVVNEIETYPTEIELSDAEAMQAFISLENLTDYVEDTDGLEAAFEHLRAQGYPARREPQKD
jgi:hypothetical protein